MRVCLFLEGQEWDQYLALADAAEAVGLMACSGATITVRLRSATQRGPSRRGQSWPPLAARTERLRLGPLVSPVTFRHPRCWPSWS